MGKKQKVAQLRLQRNQLMEAGKWEEALAVTNALINLAPSASRYTRRSMILINLGHYEEAVVDLEKALSLGLQSSKQEKKTEKIPEKTPQDRSTQIQGKRLSMGEERPLYAQTKAFLSERVERMMAQEEVEPPVDTFSEEKTEITSPSHETDAETVGGFAGAKTERIQGALSSQESTRLPLPEHVSAKALLVGTRLGDYVVQEKIGQGGMGSVYKATHHQLKQTVAIKTLSGVEVTPELVQRFNQEAQLAARLQHPNIVPIYNFGVEQEIYYLVMQWVDGVPLSTLLLEKKMSPPQALDIMQQITKAISYAHSEGVIHRDLKPSNVMIDRWGRALVLDFGLAKSTQADSDITRSGQIVGTPKYMSPEQAGGKLSEIDARTDVYSMGVMLYEMLTGKCPFDGESTYTIIYKILHVDPVPLHKVNARLHRDLQTIVEKAMAKEKQMRYADASDFQEDILRYVHGEAILAKPPGLGYRASKWMLRHPTLSGTLALSLFFLLAILSWYIFGYDPHMNLKCMYHQAKTHEERTILLGTLSSQAGKKDASFLLDVLGKGSSQEQALALQMLANLEERVAPERLDDFLSSPDDSLVRAAMYAIGRYSLNQMAPRLESFISPSQDWKIRLGALEALVQMGSPKCVPLCIEALNDNDAVRESAQKMLLRMRERSIPLLLNAFLGPYNESVWKAGHVLRIMGSEVVPKLFERMRTSDKSQKMMIFKLAAAIQDPECIRFLASQLQTAQEMDLERKAYTLLQDLQKKYPEDRMISDVLSSHHRRFSMLLEAQCFGTLNERLPHKVKIFSEGRYFKKPELHILLSPHLVFKKDREEEEQEKKKEKKSETEKVVLPVPWPPPSEGISFSLVGKAATHLGCSIELRDEGRVIDTISYFIQIIGITGLHCNIYDTDDPIALGNQTKYIVEVRNEGTAPLTNLRFLSQVTPELEILTITLPSGKEVQARSQTCTEKRFFLVDSPLEPGGKIRYIVTCKAVKDGSALYATSITYDQFSREIVLSEGTMVYLK